MYSIEYKNLSVGGYAFQLTVVYTNKTFPVEVGRVGKDRADDELVVPYSLGSFPLGSESTDVLLFDEDYALLSIDKIDALANKWLFIE